MTNANNTPPAKHRYHVHMTETRFWVTEVAASSQEEACDIAEELEESAWNIGDSDFEIDIVERRDHDEFPSPSSK